MVVQILLILHDLRYIQCNFDVILDFLRSGFTKEDGGFVFVDLLTRAFAIYFKDVNNLLAFLNCGPAKQ